ncbi:MAG TPA: hypothetical protein VIJ57_07645, partial [Hanamia sp.]
KINFNGSYMYLDNVKPKENHFVVFIDLQSEKELNSKKELTGKCILLDNNQRCYIVKSENLHKIAFKWAPDGVKGTGFEARLLPYFKQHSDQKDTGGPNVIDRLKVTDALIKRFKKWHNIEDLDRDFDRSIIWTIEDFENNYYKEK